MKQVFQKSGSLAMALLVLFSTMSFTVNKHFCGDFLVDQAVFAEAESCGMEHHPGMSEDNGCSDDSVTVEGQKDLKISFNDLDLDQQVFLFSFTHSYSNLFEEQLTQAVPYLNYIPPLLVYDIQLLDETFLI